MRLLGLVCTFVFVSAVVHAKMARYDVDPDHTTIGFSAVHMNSIWHEVEQGKWIDWRYLGWGFKGN